MTEPTSEANENKPAIWFWIVGAVALLWNLMGVVAFLLEATASPETLVESYGEAGAATVLARPVWATAAFALAVFGGTLGCLLLLLRRRSATWLLLASLLAVITQQLYWWLMLGLANSLQGSGWAMPLMIPVVAAFLLWMARQAAAKNWLK